MAQAGASWTVVIISAARAGPCGGTNPITMQILPFLVTAGIFPAGGKVYFL